MISGRERMVAKCGPPTAWVICHTRRLLLAASLGNGNLSQISSHYFFISKNIFWAPVLAMKIFLCTLLCFRVWSLFWTLNSPLNAALHIHSNNLSNYNLAVQIISPSIHIKIRKETIFFLQQKYYLKKAPFILCKFDIKDNSGAVNGKFIGAETQKFHLTTLFAPLYHFPQQDLKSSYLYFSKIKGIWAALVAWSQV